MAAISFASCGNAQKPAEVVEETVDTAMVDTAAVDTAAVDTAAVAE